MSGLDLEAKLAAVVTDYRGWKKEMCAVDWRAPASDIPIRVEAFLGDRPLALVVVGERDEALAASAILRVGFGVDGLILGYDAHMKAMTHEQYEREGPPPPGSLQKACHDEHACERGEITDVLVFHALAGSEELNLFAPYALRETKPHLAWASPEGHSEALGGYIIETLRKIMQRHTPFDALKDAPRLVAEPLEWTIRAKALRSLRAFSLSLNLMFTKEEYDMLKGVDPGLVKLMMSVPL